MSSSRLSGKVMRPILGRPMIELQIERLRRCKRVDKWVLATSTHPEDDLLRKLCDRIGLSCFRGGLDNVLDRFYQAAKPYNPKHILRLTGDCPLADPVLIDDLVDFFFRKGLDYASNCLEPTLPDGLDAEVFTFEALRHAWQQSELPSHLEHVTSFIRLHPERFKIGTLKYHRNLSKYRWTVDEKEDFEFVKRVYEALYSSNPEFTTEDIFALLEKEPGLSKINEHLRRNEGLKKSDEKDMLYLSRKEIPDDRPIRFNTENQNYWKDHQH
jgi:spore coat polysaccharide biosynthesis protein SpsF